MGIMVRERAQYHESGLMEVAQNSGSTSCGGSELQDEVRLPTGWEKCLDLKSGLIYFKNWNTGTLTYRDPRQSVQQPQRIGLLSISLEEQQQAPAPLSCKRKFDDNNNNNNNRVSSTVDGLELSLNLPGTTVQTSVCTMERVRSALERSQWSTQHKRRLQTKDATTTTTSSNPGTTLSLFSSSSVSPKSESSESSSECFTSPSVMSFQGDESEEVQQQPRECGKGSTVMVTVGCKSCLMYVMLSKSHPSCPKCGNTDDVLLELPMPSPIPTRRRLKSPSSWSWCTE